MVLIPRSVLTNIASRMRAYASVRNAVTDSSVVELVKEIKKIQELPVTEEELAQAKAKYVGDFVLALNDLQPLHAMHCQF